MNTFADLSAVEFAALYMGLVVPEDNLVPIFIFKISICVTDYFCYLIKANLIFLKQISNSNICGVECR